MADIREVAGTGDRLATLRALRDELAKAIPDAAPGVLSPLAKQLMEVLAQIDALDGDAKKEGTALDEFTKRLEAKRRANSEAVGSS